MSAERTCLPCQPPLPPPTSNAQAGLSAAPQAHSPLLLSDLRGQAAQENRSPVGPRALASRTPQRQLPFKPGRTLLDEGSHSMSLSVLQVASLPAFVPALPLAVADLLSPCLGGTRTSHMPVGNATRSRGDTQEAQACSAAAPKE